MAIYKLDLYVYILCYIYTMAMYTNWKYIVNNLLGHKHKMAIMYDHGNILAM